MRVLKIRSYLAVSAACVALLAAGGIAEDKPVMATGTVSGVVKDADGSPVAGATVRLTAPKAEKKAKPTVEEPKDGKEGKKKAGLRASTDDKGMFKIENVPAGEYNVTAKLKGKGAGIANVTVAAGQDATAEITLHERAGGKKKPE
jgi:hypothetical protein